MRKVGDEVWFYEVLFNPIRFSIYQARIFDVTHGVADIEYMQNNGFKETVWGECIEIFDTFEEALQAALERVNGCPRCGSKGIHTCRIKGEG